MTEDEYNLLIDLLDVYLNRINEAGGFSNAPQDVTNRYHSLAQELLTCQILAYRMWKRNNPEQPKELAVWQAVFKYRFGY